MLLLLFKLLHDEGNQTIFVIRNIHHIKVLPEQFSDLFHLHGSDNLTLGDAGLSNLRALPKHIRQFRIGRLDSGSSVFDRHFLLGNQQGNDSRDIYLAPAIRNALIPALNIEHGCGQLCAILHDQVFFNLGGSISVGLRTRKHHFCACQYGNDIRIGLRIFLN